MPLVEKFQVTSVISCPHGSETQLPISYVWPEHISFLPKTIKEYKALKEVQNINFVVNKYNKHYLSLKDYHQ